MYFTFVYNGSYDYDGYTVQLDDYEYSIRDNKDDVIEYLYEKHFDRPYSGYYVGSEEMNYVSELENKWLYNEIDFIALYYEDYAFKDCDDLTNVIKPDGIRIGKDAFKGTPWLKKQK